jgi:hypothetical protein
MLAYAASPTIFTLVPEPTMVANTGPAAVLAAVLGLAVWAQWFPCSESARCRLQSSSLRGRGFGCVTGGSAFVCNGLRDTLWGDRWASSRGGRWYRRGCICSCDDSCCS